MDEDNCPYGDSCSFHFREDMSVVTDKDVLIINYVGDYVVQTMVAPELMSPMVKMLQTQGIIEIPALVSIVSYVGSEESLESSKATVPDDQLVRFYERHSNIKDPRSGHDLLVEIVRTGGLDLSTPITPEELEADSKRFFLDGIDRIKQPGFWDDKDRGFDL